MYFSFYETFVHFHFWKLYNKNISKNEINEVILLSFGSKLKELRINNDLTQIELAEKLNMSKANISKYEADLIEPNLDTLKKISLLFNVSVNELLEIQTNKIAVKTLPQNIVDLIKQCSALNKEELKKVSEYIEFLKSKHS